MNKCCKCYKEISSTTSLLKLKNGKWYCISCICYDKEIFNLLHASGYWYNQLKPFVHFKIDD